jgi:hypothetical protein
MRLQRILVVADNDSLVGGQRRASSARQLVQFTARAGFGRRQCGGFTFGHAEPPSRFDGKRRIGAKVAVDRHAPASRRRIWAEARSRQ